MRPEPLRRLVPRLEPLVDRADLLAQRLSAARLADRRLEAQRAAGAPLWGEVARAMRDVLGAAKAEDPKAAVASVERLQQGLEALRAVGAP